MIRQGVTVRRKATILVLAAFVILIMSATVVSASVYAYPETPQRPIIDDYHGRQIIDNYAWLENAQDQAVIDWTRAQEIFTHSIIDTCSQRKILVTRLNALKSYNAIRMPHKALNSDRLFVWTKHKDAQQWVYGTLEHEDAKHKILLDPNQWDSTNILSDVTVSHDGKYTTFGTTQVGHNNPIIQIMVTETGKILDDKLKGWQQTVEAWLPDNSGFYYSCKPLAGEVPEGEHKFWQSTWLHKLGDHSRIDIKVFGNKNVKDYQHRVWLNDEGNYTIYSRSLFKSNQLFFEKFGASGDPVPLVTHLEATYDIDIISGKILLTTNHDAPRKMVYITDVNHPERQHWKVFLPEHADDTLSHISTVNGHIYAHYAHNAHRIVKIFDLAGNFLRDLPLPTIGIGEVTGNWTQPEVWVSFSSYAYPSTIFKYHFDKDQLEIFDKVLEPVERNNFTTEQVWYSSKDGTPISMFIVHHKDLELDGNNPTLLTGYGGFSVSQSPQYSPNIVVWLEAGGVYAIPNLRGGGEYGEAWHRAGTAENKQNVFDDFICAAEYLINQQFTNPDRLAISGGSNGGLLVGAVTVQRPELFKAVHCRVALLDMLKYHHFSIANLWASEYGTSEDPEQFKYLQKYSPYHNVSIGVKYPAFIVTSNENDALVDPCHARKMAARMQYSDRGGGPIMLLVYQDGGHYSSTTISKRIYQRAEVSAFLMDQLGMAIPHLLRQEQTEFRFASCL